VNKTRLALYAFMQAQLRGVFNDSGIEAQPAPTEAWSYADLCITSTGYVNSAPELNRGSGSISTHEAFVRPVADMAVAALRAARDVDGGAPFLQRVRRVAGEVVGCVAPRTALPGAPVAPTPVPASAGLPKGTVRYILQSEGRCRVALDVLPASAPLHTATADTPAAPRALAALYVSRKGGSIERPRPGQLSDAERARVDALRAAGLAVVLVDVCGFGVAADPAGDAFGLFDLPSYDFRVKLSQPVDGA
jgi:hypothetical protein